MVLDAKQREAAQAGQRASTLMRGLNRNVRSFSARLHQTEPIAFFCECGMSTCFTTVWKTKTEFDSYVEGPEGWVLADGHRASERPTDRLTDRPVDDVAGSPPV